MSFNNFNLSSYIIPVCENTVTGIYDDTACDNTKHNHAVLIVGYGTDAAQGDYWIVKNRYGEGIGWDCQGEESVSLFLVGSYR